jgi:hypothetical protein
VKEEAEMVMPDCKTRLQQAVEDLSMFVVSSAHKVSWQTVSFDITDIFHCGLFSIAGLNVGRE